MEGRQINDSQWRQIEGFLPGRPGSVGVTARDNRRFVDGVLWVLRSGAQWQDLPEDYGKWKSVHKRYTGGPVPVFGRRCFRCCWRTRTAGM